MSGVSKIEYFGRVLLDLTGDSVAANKMLAGIIAHDKTGALIEGTIPTVEQATPEIEISSSGLITVSAEQAEGFVTGGTKSATKQLTTKGATTVTPTSAVQTIVNAGTYVTGAIKVAASTGKAVYSGTYSPTANTSSPVINVGVTLGEDDIFVIHQYNQNYPDFEIILRTPEGVWPAMGNGGYGSYTVTYSGKNVSLSTTGSLFLSAGLNFHWYLIKG